MHTLLIISARDRAAPDKLTLTIHGPKTEDRRRLTNVLTRLMQSDAEWDSPRPNADLIVTMDSDGPPATVPVAPEVLERCAVKVARSEDLDRDQTEALMDWCDCQSESLWDGMSLQTILNVYRISAEWDTWEGWRSEEFDAAGEAWDRVVPAAHRLEYPTIASRQA